MWLYYRTPSGKGFKIIIYDWQQGTGLLKVRVQLVTSSDWSISDSVCINSGNTSFIWRNVCNRKIKQTKC